MNAKFSRRTACSSGSSGPGPSSCRAVVPFTAERNRVIMARDLVNDFQHALADGDFDRRQFDDTISSIQRVADMNRLSDATRSYLLDDVRQLRDFARRLLPVGSESRYWIE